MLLCSHEVSSLVTSQLTYGTSPTNKSAKRTYEGVCLQCLGYFNVNCTQRHARKKRSIALKFFTTLLDDERAEEIDSTVGEGGAGLVRSSGNSAIRCSCATNRNFRHVTHLEITRETAAEAPMIQYPCARNSFIVIPRTWCCIEIW